MNDDWINQVLESFNDTKKLLRFRTDRPQCQKCGLTDWRQLCNVAIKQNGGKTILCRNCLAKQKTPSEKALLRKAKRFRDAGYFEPACVVCLEPLQILEYDHLDGRANSDLAEPLCPNHHAIKSYMAESGPMATLRVGDPARTALAFEAAFDFGLASMLGIMAAADSGDHTARAVFFGFVAAALFAWGCWNLSADRYFIDLLGPSYDRAIPATVPR